MNDVHHHVDHVYMHTWSNKHIDIDGLEIMIDVFITRHLVTPIVIHVKL